jgi:hypothetical protein
MMVKRKEWETPTMDSANIEPGNFYAVYEALLQGHQATQYELITAFLMCIGPCIVVIDEEENQLDAPQYFIELVIGSTCFGHHYAHRQEL